MVQLDFERAQKLLRKYKIPAPKGFLAKTREQATLYAVEIGFPVTLKASSAKILHKTDVGAVKLNLKNREEVERAYDELVGKFPAEDIEGIIVQKMVPGQYVLIGMKRVRQFGPVIAFGLGGIFVEVLKDVSFRIAPITKQDAREMMEEIKAYPMLAGVRGKKPVNLKLLEKILMRVSRLSVDHPQIEELDLNPVIVNEEEAFAVDARFIIGVKNEA